MSLFSRTLVLGFFATSLVAQTIGDASETVVFGSGSMYAANPTATAVVSGLLPYILVNGVSSNVQGQSDISTVISALTTTISSVSSVAVVIPTISTGGGATERSLPVNALPSVISSAIGIIGPVASALSSSVDPGNVATSTSTVEASSWSTVTSATNHGGGGDAITDPVGAQSTSIIPGTTIVPSVVATTSDVSSAAANLQSTTSIQPNNQLNIAQSSEPTSSAQSPALSTNTAAPDPSSSPTTTQTAPGVPTSATPEAQNIDSSASDTQLSSSPSSVVVNGLFFSDSSSVPSPVEVTPTVTDGASTTAQTQATDHTQGTLTGTPEAQGNIIATPSSEFAQTPNSLPSTTSVTLTADSSQDQITQTLTPTNSVNTNSNALPSSISASAVDPALLSGTASSDFNIATTGETTQITGSSLQSGTNSVASVVASVSGALQTATLDGEAQITGGASPSVSGAIGSNTLSSAASGDPAQITDMSMASDASETASAGSTSPVVLPIALASTSASASDPSSSNALSGSSISTSATATSRNPNRIVAQPTTTAPSLPASLTVFTSGGSVFTVPLSSALTKFTSGGSTFTVPFSSMSASTVSSDTLSSLYTFSTGTLTGTNSATATGGDILGSANPTTTGATNNGTAPAGTGSTPKPVIIGATIGSVMAAALSAIAIIVFCIRRKHKRNGRRLSIDEYPIVVSSQLPSRAASQRASHWSASSRATTLARDVELDGEHDGSEHGYDDGEVRHLHERGCLAQMQRILRQIFELETVERPQELETVEKPQELEGDTVSCMATMQAILWRLLARDTHEFKEVENIDYMDELKKQRQWQLPSQRTSFTAAASEAELAQDSKRQGKLKVTTDPANDSTSAIDFIQEIKDQNRRGRAELDSQRASIVSPMTEPRTDQGSMISPYLGKTRSLVSPFPELSSRQRSIVEASPELRGSGPSATQTPDIKSQQGSQRSAMTTSSKKSDGEETQTYEELQDFMDWLNKRRSDPDA